MRTAGGSAAAATGVAAASGTASAQQEEPDFEGYLDGVDGGFEDLRGQEEVTVMVGAGDGLQFSPAGIWIDEGTTVVWEWTGDGGDHNVTVDEENTAFENTHQFESETTAEAGFTFEYTFDEPGRTGYVCTPHRGVDMFGAVAVGDDVPTVEIVEDGAWPEDIGDVGIPLQKHYVGIVTFFGIALTFVFTFYVLKYGESANTGRGN